MPQLTNKMLMKLLAKLGFKSGNVTAKNNRVWEHPESDCTLFLPNNKVNEEPRPGDVVGMRTQLDMHGHLDEQTFDAFVTEGKIPAQVAG